jgi:hypothetical protein
MKKLLIVAFVAILPVVMAGCGPGASVQVNTPDSSMQFSAPGPNPMLNQTDSSGRVARAVARLWHGIIAPVTLLISFFSSDVRMYEVHNAGSEYDLGSWWEGMVIAVLVFHAGGDKHRTWETFVLCLIFRKDLQLICLKMNVIGAITYTLPLMKATTVVWHCPIN